MVNNQHLNVIKRYFDEHSFVESSMKSFNNFIDIELQRIVNEVGEIKPQIIPPDVDEFKIKFDNIYIEKPSIIEADGSKRRLLPIEARLRQLTYSAPMYLEVSTHVDGIQRESFTTQISKLPIMLRSKYCHLHNKTSEELIEMGEDPGDFGGYFIINGNERILITVEDLLPNKVFITKSSLGPSKYTAKLFSQRGSYSIPHVIEQMKDGIIYLSFAKLKRVPIVTIIKALGLMNDQEIMNAVKFDNKEYDEMYVNLYNSIDIKTQEEALEIVAKKLGINQPTEIRVERAKSFLDLYLLPHLGVSPKERGLKAYNLCRIIKKFLLVSVEGLEPTDKDHYKNKKLKLPGDLMADLFRVNMRVLVNDVVYNFQRLVKRGKFQSVKIIIRDKLLSSRIKSAMATGSWVGGRKGVSQNIDRINYMSTLSHLSRVVSLLSASQENFDARELHSTHWGRLCPIETPEGPAIGLRKNLAMLCQITQDEVSEEKVKKMLEGIGLKLVK